MELDPIQVEFKRVRETNCQRRLNMKTLSHLIIIASPGIANNVSSLQHVQYWQELESMYATSISIVMCSNISKGNKKVKQNFPAEPQIVIFSNLF